MSPILTGVIASGISGNLTPPWSPQGAYDALGTITLSTSVNSFSFTNIPQEYSSLELRCLWSQTNTANNTWVRVTFNNDTGANYSLHAWRTSGSTLFASAVAPSNYVSFGSDETGDATSWGVSIASIIDYTNTNKFKTTRALSGQERNSSGVVGQWGGNWRSYAPVNSIQIAADSGINFRVGSTFALYGVK